MLFLLACATPQPPADRALHARALETLESDPAGAAALCAQVRDPSLAADCGWAAAAALAEEDPLAAEGVCSDLTAAAGALAGEECWFLLAEATGEARWCGSAGRFERDCRMHLFTRGARAWVDPDPAEAEAAAAEAMAAVGLDPVDPAPWSAAWRAVLSAQRPLDRGACAAVSDPARREACEMTAIQVFHDRLNRGRDTGASLCEGPLPERLAYLPDPALDRALAERRAADLCDSSATRPPPLDAP